MKIRIVIEEIIVDAECQDTYTPVDGAKTLLAALSEKALMLFEARAKLNKELKP